MLELEEYDAGILSTYGGGDVSWWQDYMRAELARAYDFYCDQVRSHDDHITKQLKMSTEP